MATMKFIVLAAACACAYAFPQDPTGAVTRNTIFADEKFEGGAFEDLETMEQFHSRNDDRSSIYRLPNTTRPHHYYVIWQIDMDRLYMNGEVTIEILPTVEGVNEIVIQSDNLTIVDVYLQLGSTEVPTLPYVVDDELHFLRIPLANGSLVYNSTTPVYYNLTVSFNAPLRTNMYGIYRSWYRNDPSNLTEPVRWMATTQFQATAARYAFPCYDEPSFKATFDIVIRRPTGFRSWALTRLNYTRNTTFNGYQEDVFTRTPVMSTYLLALIVAEYETQDFNNPATGELMYEVIARPGAMIANQSDYAFAVGMELLAEMSNHTDKDYYGVNSNLKMTQASIPDFGAGAMENWGLLTYREAYLMYDEEHTNSYFKQLIAYILSHEIAHMWFGNLVTCDWWDVLWLNEGFARYYQYFLTNWVEDYMGFETRFVIEQVHTSLLSDSSNNPHPLSTTSIGSPATVSAMFSTLTYNKGASVIRMTEHFLGFDVHREGLRNYLDQKEFQTALPIDLFAALQNVSEVRGAISAYGPNFSVIDYYRSWTEQGGHPVLNVQVNHQTGEMVIYQRRFNINTGYSINNNNNYIVPITFATASNPDFNDTKPTHVISQSVTTIQRGSIGDEWVIFNKQQTGFYRVNYDDYTWDLIVLQLRGENRTQIHEYNRAQIVNDVFQFARSGLMSYTRAFNILSFLEFETEYAPWVAAITGFTWLRNRLAGTPYLAPLEDQIIQWSARAIARLTYLPTENEDFMDSYLRYQLAPTLCAIDVADCRTNATAQFRALVDRGVEVPVDSRNWVYCTALRHGTEADFNYLWNRFLRHNVYTEKIQLLMVLGCTPHANSLRIFLDGIVNENFVIRPQDYTTAFNGAVTGNEVNTQIVFQYIQDNLALVTDAFGSAATPISYVSARLRTPEEITAFQTWANSSAEVLGNAYQSVYNGAANSIYNLNYVAEIQSDLNNFFEAGYQPVQLSSPAPVTDAPVSTVTPPAVVEPVTPDLQLPSSAVNTYVSMLIIALAVLVNIIL